VAYSEGRAMPKRNLRAEGHKTKNKRRITDPSLSTHSHKKKQHNKTNKIFHRFPKYDKEDSDVTHISNQQKRQIKSQLPNRIKTNHKSVSSKI
jgi:hypothetical protein